MNSVVSFQSPGVIMTLLAFILVISVLVAVHEWGHFIAARLFKMKVTTFSIGFGPELFGRTDKHGTRWKLSGIPLGGYVSLAGENDLGREIPDEDLSKEDRAIAFQHRPLWQRTIVIAAGPGINFLFAIVIFSTFFFAFGNYERTSDIQNVAADSPALVAGLQPGDRVVRIDGDPVETFNDIARHVGINTGTMMRFEVMRQGRLHRFQVTPEVTEYTDNFGNRFNRSRIGITSTTKVKKLDYNPLEAIAAATSYTGMLIKMQFRGLLQILTGQRSTRELSGPVKIAQLSGQQASLGPFALITFIGNISIMLGFMNLLPIPMLDGGHLLLYAIEAVIGRPINAKVQEWIYATSFAFLIGLALYVTLINDLGLGS